MFTGIISEVGKILEIKGSSNFLALKVKCEKILSDSKPGDSVAVNGVCLTIETIGETYFEAHLSKETLHKTSFSSYKKGIEVNLEHPLRLNDKLSGHLVLGHIDGTVTIKYIKFLNSVYEIAFNYHSNFAKYLANKGSVCLDGISLTISKLYETFFEVAVIPFTFENTTLKYKRVGDKVNLEVDVISRYLERLLRRTISKGPYLEEFFNE